VVLRRGLSAATPVVMTLASMPAHAEAACVNPSGFISRATFNSRHPGAIVCSANGPSHFKALADSAWPVVGSASAASLRFTAIFGGPLLTGAPNRNVTLKDVLASNVYPAFAKYCVALYANALLPPPGFPVTVDQARALWATIRNGTMPSGVSVPFPALALGWDETKTLDWLSTVMNA
jgi:hypothetical protein